MCSWSNASVVLNLGMFTCICLIWLGVVIYLQHWPILTICSTYIIRPPPHFLIRCVVNPAWMGSPFAEQGTIVIVSYMSLGWLVHSTWYMWLRTIMVGSYVHPTGILQPSWVHDRRMVWRLPCGITTFLRTGPDPNQCKMHVHHKDWTVWYA